MGSLKKRSAASCFLSRCRVDSKQRNGTGPGPPTGAPGGPESRESLRMPRWGIIWEKLTATVCETATMAWVLPMRRAKRCDFAQKELSLAWLLPQTLFIPLLPALGNSLMPGLPGKLAERLAVLPTEASEHRGTSWRETGLSFSPPAPHRQGSKRAAPSIRCCCGRLPSGCQLAAGREPGPGLCSLSVSWLRSGFSPWEFARLGRGSCPPRSRRACERAGRPPCPCGST
jgi:hypothetical protein